MPIGIVSDEDFLKELGQPKTADRNVVPQIIDITPSHGRNSGDVNVPDSLRQIIGEEAVINGRQAALDLAKDFGISPSSVSAYTKGATSTTTYHEPKSSILKHINKSRERSIKKAGKVLSGALAAISQEKLDYTDAKDLAGIAKDMSAIIKNLEPKDVVPSDQANGPQFVIFAPQFRQENSFDHITVNE